MHPYIIEKDHFCLRSVFDPLYNIKMLQESQINMSDGINCQLGFNGYFLSWIGFVIQLGKNKLNFYLYKYFWSLVTPRCVCIIPWKTPVGGQLVLYSIEIARSGYNRNQ